MLQTKQQKFFKAGFFFLLLFIVVLFMFLGEIGYCDNGKTGKTSTGSSLNYEEISVDTDPGADGYAGDSVIVKSDINPNAKEMFFYIDQLRTGSEVILQNRRAGRSFWTDYETYTATTYLKVENSAVDREWRVFIDDGKEGTGTDDTIAGLEW
ncbi:MAG: hypothetical protein KAI40_03445 [Desulfobacterales bacterium]|nr:hypothetical protein [Desulfobacterales bacterium]